MRQSIKLILLPGMDGTGKLFEPILTSLPSSIDVEVVTFSELGSNDIQLQTQALEKRIGEQEVVIFAESYSGSIAYQLAQGNSNIKHIVFAASFLSSPSYLSKFAYLVPLSVLRFKLVPSWFLSWLFFGNYRRKDLVDLFEQAIARVSDRNLRERLKIIASLTEPNIEIEIPCTYIQASKDKLVNSRSLKIFQRLCIDLNVERIEGGHFIAQSNPEKCVEVTIDTFDF